MAELELCRNCHQALPDDAPWGLCPACLFSQAIESEVNGPPPATSSESIDDMPQAAEFPGSVGRYRLTREIGRGGMGQVILGFDLEIGREIALKVLLQKYRDSSKMILRFVEEAQIGGQLVHPAIVPVYERGTFLDGRPFFVMKLVEGRTLADLLHSRSDPAEDLPRFLSIFDQVCQAMAYAHARKVIHRDLKSPNVMVGAFGEVQTMDWGMAKRLAGHDRPEALRLAPTSVVGPLVSVDGSVKGTPNYMSPEQARGESDRLDERTDVFSLGAILCEILTGRPPYLGESSEEILAKAATADLLDAMTALETCGADVELLALARHCLATEPEDRPGHAGKVAEAVASYFAGVQDRLRQAELDRVEAETRAIEESKRRVLADKLADEAEGRATSEQKRRRLQLGLAAAVVALTTMGGIGTALLQQQKSARAASIAKVIEVAATMLEVARATPENIPRWRTTLAAAQQAEGLAAGDPVALGRVGKLRDEAQAGVDAAEHDKALLDRIVEIRSSRSDDPEGVATDAAYDEAFRVSGLDLATQNLDDLVAKIKGRPSLVAQTIASALDDWSFVRGRLRNDRAFARRLTEVARGADPNVWRNNLRTTLGLPDDDGRRQAALKALVDSANFRELEPISLLLLGQNLDDLALAEKVLQQAQRYYPDDVWVNFGLAHVLEQRQRRELAVRYYTAARALRPETAHDFAHLLIAMGESSEGIDVFQELARLRPDNSRYLNCLGNALKDRGRSPEAVPILNQAEAVALEKIRVNPNSHSLYFQLASTLQAEGKLDQAIARYREAIRLRPDHVAYSNLGNILRSQGKARESIAEFQAAIKLKPEYAEAHSNLGAALINLKRFDEAVASLNEAIRLKPDLAVVQYNLGTALQAQGKLEPAIAAFRKAILLKPDLGPAHGNLGVALANQDKIDEAIAEFREVIRLSPDLAMSYSNLGELLRTRGDYAGSLAAYRKAHAILTRNRDRRYPSVQWVAEAERLAGLADRLPEFLKGDDHPKDADDCLALAQMCRNQKRYAAATRFLVAALNAEPNQGADRQAQLRYDGACGAILAAAGQTQDDPPPDEAARIKLRGQALEWLTAELAAWTMELATGPPNARPSVAQILEHWREDADLASIRDPQALAKLPEVEQKQWQTLWANVAELETQARTKSP